MKLTVSICLALFALAGFAVFAAGQTYTTTDDGPRIVTINPAKVAAPQPSVTADQDQASLTTLFSNLSDYRYATYFCCSGVIISGPNAQQGFGETWLAIPFTPKANLTFVKIEAPLFSQSGTPSIAVWLAADADGVPGDTIAGPVDLDNLSQIFAGCCTLSKVKFANLSLFKRTRYWVVVGTDPNSLDSMDVWNFNTADMRRRPYAFYAAFNGKWLSLKNVLPAIGIFGR